MAVATDNVMDTWKETFNVHRVFGDPIEKDGFTVIPVAKVAGGGGGGTGQMEGQEGSEGSGSGFGGMARPAGAYIVRGDSVQWKPALDITMLALAGIALAALMSMVAGSAVKSWR